MCAPDGPTYSGLGLEHGRDGVLASFGTEQRAFVEALNVAAIGPVVLSLLS